MDDLPLLIWETFVIRLWRESANDAWRGQIVHLPDRAMTHFAAFDQAEEFIRRFTPDILSRSEIEETRPAQPAP